MNLKLLILVLTAICNKSFGQSYSFIIDSLTKTHLAHLSKSKQSKFDDLLEQRLKDSILYWIDTSNFDIAFIEELYCFDDTSAYVIERYFFRNDTIPKMVYTNGYFSDVKEIYNINFIWYSQYVHANFTLNPLLRKYEQLKHNQELLYEKEQIWSHGCVVFDGDESTFIKSKKSELKSTYCKMIMIDKTSRKVIVSVQTAPSNPTFNVIGYNAVWDF